MPSDIVLMYLFVRHKKLCKPFLSWLKDEVRYFGDKKKYKVGFPMKLHVTNQKMGRIKRKNGWISAIDSYLTVSHLSLLKEDKP